MSRTFIVSALLGAAHGAAEAAVLFAMSERYTISKDWFLLVMIVFANASGFALAAHYGVSLIGVAVAGLLGMMLGGWLGAELIGSYEYRVPTPREERVMRFVSKHGVREVEMPGVPDEQIKRIPVGAGIGLLLGWILAAGTYAWLARPPEEPEEMDEEETDHAQG
jgi:hypothetical protein